MVSEFAEVAASQPQVVRKGSTSDSGEAWTSVTDGRWLQFGGAEYCLEESAILKRLSKRLKFMLPTAAEN